MVNSPTTPTAVEGMEPSDEAVIEARKAYMRSARDAVTNLRAALRVAYSIDRSPAPDLIAENARAEIRKAALEEASQWHDLEAAKYAENAASAVNALGKTHFRDMAAFHSRCATAIRSLFREATK